MLLLLLSIPVSNFFWKSCNLVRSYAVSWILFLITMSSGKWHSSQNYANLSLLFALCFSTKTCPNEASNFTFRFSPSLFQALSYTCLSFPCSLKTISVTYSKRRNKQTSSAFKLVQNRTAMVQARIIVPAEKSNEQDCKNRSFTLCRNGGKEMLFNTCMSPTHSRNTV